MTSIFIIALATTYAASAITEQAISQPWRNWLIEHTLNKSNVHDWFRDLLLCRTCISFWVAAALTALTGDFDDFLIRTLAAAGAAFIWIEFTKAISRPAPKPIAPVAGVTTVKKDPTHPPGQVGKASATVRKTDDD